MAVQESTEMTAYISPELERMAARCRLPISVYYDGSPGTSGFFCRYWIWPANDPGNIDTLKLVQTPDEATRAYVALRAELEKA